MCIRVCYKNETVSRDHRRQLLSEKHCVSYDGHCKKDDEEDGMTITSTGDHESVESCSSSSSSSAHSYTSESSSHASVPLICPSPRRAKPNCITTVGGKCLFEFSNLNILRRNDCDEDHSFATENDEGEGRPTKEKDAINSCVFRRENVIDCASPSIDLSIADILPPLCFSSSSLSRNVSPQRDVLFTPSNLWKKIPTMNVRDNDHEGVLGYNHDISVKRDDEEEGRKYDAVGGEVERQDHDGDVYNYDGRSNSHESSPSYDDDDELSFLSSFISGDKPTMPPHFLVHSSSFSSGSMSLPAIISPACRFKHIKYDSDGDEVDSDESDSDEGLEHDDSVNPEEDIEEVDDDKRQTNDGFNNKAPASSRILSLPMATTIPLSSRPEEENLLLLQLTCEEWTMFDLPLLFSRCINDWKDS